MAGENRSIVPLAPPDPAAFANASEFSATVSRWMKGTHEPTEKRTSLWAISLDLPKMLIFGSEQALIQAVSWNQLPDFGLVG